MTYFVTRLEGRGLPCSRLKAPPTHPPEAGKDLEKALGRIPIFAVGRRPCVSENDSGCISLKGRVRRRLPPEPPPGPGLASANKCQSPRILALVSDGIDARDAECPARLLQFILRLRLAHEVTPAIIVGHEIGRRVFRCAAVNTLAVADPERASGIQRVRFGSVHSSSVPA